MHAEPSRLLPILLPSWQTTTVTWRQTWNIVRDHSHLWTVLDDLPMPTDQKAGGSSPSKRATSERATSTQARHP